MILALRHTNFEMIKQGHAFKFNPPGYSLKQNSQAEYNCINYTKYVQRGLCSRQVIIISRKIFTFVCGTSITFLPTA